jgi:hypothetical protein
MAPKFIKFPGLRATGPGTPISGGTGRRMAFVDDPFYTAGVLNEGHVMSPRRIGLLMAVGWGVFVLGCAGNSVKVKTVQSPPTDSRRALYVSNREPLLPSALVKLPIGSITPKGWLRNQLELEAKGMSGRLPDVSEWVKYDGNAWVNPEGKGHSGWEEMPYWLKGYGDLGYVLKDERIRKETQTWMEAILKSQREDGWFGPRSSLTSLDGKPDLWPNMLVLNILQSYYEVSGDERVMPFMTKYYRWQLNCPDEIFMAGYWPKMRAGDNIESIYWLYNRTGEKWLLDVAAKCHKHMARWDTDVINWHGVNFTQGFREPAVYYMQTKDAKHLAAMERNYAKALGMYGQMPGGMFVADENARPGYDDPRGGAETCSMVEFMHSFEMLTKITADPKWADRCEEVAFNSFPAALTADWKGLHYLTGANQIQLDRGNKAPGVQNGGTMFSYSPHGRYRCCQHNVAHGWPYYAQELWLATADRGLCASLYAASEVTAKVGDGSSVRIVEETDYPFSDQIKLTIADLKRPVRFPLYLRVPKWCEGSEVTINNSQPATLGRLGYVVVEREWRSGDVVQLRLPMKLSVRKWVKNHNAVSVDYGPLTFSLRIGERWVAYDGTEKWPEFEVFPMTAWNYGLVIDEKNPAASFQVQRKPGPVAKQPFTLDGAPIQIMAKARKIPQWQQDSLGLVGLLQDSPAKTSEPVETVTLIPMGGARLRIAAFPTVSDGPEAREWKPQPRLPLASHCFESDTVAALNDEVLPQNSNDRDIPRFTWWDHQGTTEWVQYDFEKPRKIRGVEVYWYDDEKTGGHCRLPGGWQVMHKDGEQWKPVSVGQYEVARDRFNKVTFEAVETKSIRLQVQLQPNYSGGILEWRVVE